jgi:hypothetical protein
MFPKNDLRRVPDHWRTFGTRISPLTGSPRLAVNPPNAMLNYLYALLESETRLAEGDGVRMHGIGIHWHDLSAFRPALNTLYCENFRPTIP